MVSPHLLGRVPSIDCYCIFFFIMVSELSEVLWTMVMALGIQMSVTNGAFVGALVIFPLFAAWAGK